MLYCVILMGMLCIRPSILNCSFKKEYDVLDYVYKLLRIESSAKIENAKTIVRILNLLYIKERRRYLYLVIVRERW